MSRGIVEGEIGGFPLPWRWSGGRSGTFGGRRRWWRRGGDGSGTSLSLVVVRASDLERGRRFYEALGLEFVEEQHDSGPAHLAASLPSGAVLELYPASEDSLLDRGGVGVVRLGFVVDDLDRVLQAVRDADGRLVSEPGVAGGQLRAVVADPDGRRVELLDRGHVDG